MTIETTYTAARQHLASLCDAATDDRDVVVIKRRGREDVALIAADELTSIMESAHVLRSPVNRERLLSALQRAMGSETAGDSVEDLRLEVGLGSTKEP
jgi:antitoxin YefM